MPLSSHSYTLHLDLEPETETTCEIQTKLKIIMQDMLSRIKKHVHPEALGVLNIENLNLSHLALSSRFGPVADIDYNTVLNLFAAALQSDSKVKLKDTKINLVFSNDKRVPRRHKTEEIEEPMFGGHARGIASRPQASIEDYIENKRLSLIHI